jgi:DNA-binding GntR family transcriptional regulator
MAQFQSLSLRRVAEDVYDILREKILACELAPGDRLDVEAISVQLGISRTPVKDALQRLSAERLIEIHSRRGTFVTKITPKDVRETFEVRAALEAKACELLAGKMPASLPDQLRELNAKMFARNLGMIEHARLNNEFHRLIVENANNQRLLKVYNELNAHMQIARVHYRAKGWLNRGPKVVEEHESVILALVENRPEDAKKNMEEHIIASMNRLISQIRTDSDGREEADTPNSRVADEGGEPQGPKVAPRR